ncbi:MAG: Nif3-like dinuclear metal center hexameric protein [Bacteroidetes bacterium]|nr:MAG: Nif3-like dinuclear metal center hexameric protein [Bacteroidota bacterium]
MILKQLISFLEEFAPLSMQESYDNAGLLTGNAEHEIKSALITLDVTDEVLDEAIAGGHKLIIAHHPLIFKGLKKLTGSNFVENLVIKAIKNDIAIYAIHTNLDNMYQGVNAKLGEKLNLKNLQILQPGGSGLKKLVVYCPLDYADTVRDKMFEAGAGSIGHYENCSYNTTGQGTFRANAGTHPFVGTIGKTHIEKEIKIETVVSSLNLSKVINAMLSAHPYEEVAYDIFSMENRQGNTGAGMIGELEKEKPLLEYLKEVKKTLNAQAIKFNQAIQRPVKKVAFCGGSGSFLIHQAYRAGADLFITSDIKYHDFFEHQGAMTIVDAGHFETEQFTKELLYEIIKENFTNFALQISETPTNPVKFL